MSSLESGRRDSVPAPSRVATQGLCPCTLLKNLLQKVLENLQNLSINIINELALKFLKGGPGENFFQEVFPRRSLVLSFSRPPVLASLLLLKHHSLAVEHTGEDEDEGGGGEEVGGDGEEDLDGLIGHGEDAADALDAVIDGDEEEGKGGRAVREHTGDTDDGDKEHEGGDHAGGLLHGFSQGGEDGDEGDEEEDGGEDDGQDHEVIRDLIDRGIDHIHIRAAHELGEGQEHAQEVAKARQKGDDGEGGDLTDGQLTALDGGNEEGGDGASLLFACDGLGGHGHTAGEGEHDEEHGHEHGEDHPRQILLGGHVKDLVLGDVDVEAVGHGGLKGVEHREEEGIRGGGIGGGGVVVDLDLGGGETVGGVVGRHGLVKVLGEDHVEVVAPVVEALGDGLGVVGSGAIGALVEGHVHVGTLGDAVHRVREVVGQHAVFHVFTAAAHGVAEGAAHEGIDHVDEQAGQDDGGDHAAVAKEAAKLLFHNGQNVAVLHDHTSSPAWAL